VAQKNIDRFEATGKVDWTFLQTLSDDALPTLAKLPDDQVLCALTSDVGNNNDDWLEWNFGRARATSVLEKHEAGWSFKNDCPGQTVE
jgi:hypothetical protein